MLTIPTPIPGVPTATVPRSMVDDPAYPTVMNNPVAWQKLRCRHDFAYWCESCCKIKDKISGKDVPFVLNAPQRRVAAMLEDDRRAGRPIRIIMLKARQWGGSTLIQNYMAWIQSVHCRNWHSVICSQVKDTSSTIRGMYSKLLENYPLDLWDGDEKPRFRAFEHSRNIREIAGRGCRITIASIRNYDSIRGSDIAMAHLSETAFWSATPSASPEDLVRAICGSIAFEPYTLIAMESTANGVGNFFHNEWIRCSQGRGDKRAVFVPWFEIEHYRLDPPNPEKFMQSLSPYETMLAEKFSLSPAQIYWYHNKLREYTTHAQMMAEYPSTPEEAFANTGSSLFSASNVENLRKNCIDPPFVGEIHDDGLRYQSSATLPRRHFRFVSDSRGCLSVWQHPDPQGDYVAAVDIGGRTNRADWSVVAVLRIDSPRPEIVAQWRGHTDHDLLASVAASIAGYYNYALLAVEANSLEKDAAGHYILNQLAREYPNMYFRDSARPGFHTNSSSKGALITGLMAAVRDGSYIERCSDACTEMLNYEETSSGKYAARPGHHDDILMTRAIAIHLASLPDISLPLIPPPCQIPQ